MRLLEESQGDFAVWTDWKPPAAAAGLWPELLKLLTGLVGREQDLPGQVNRVRKFYTPLMQDRYDNPHPRGRDLEQMELIAARYRNRHRMLLEMALDPPNSTQDLAGPPILDDDYLVLSTIHSAKGLEWDAVHVIHAADGNIPSDMSTGSAEEIEEERRLFYVALTRAKNRLYVYFPLRYYHYRPGVSDRYGMAQRTRFLPPAVAQFFQEGTTGLVLEEDNESGDVTTKLTSEMVRRRAKDLWS
jgi:DNA helicase-2/ATP-dependent DNA helicase PcrA